MQSLYKIVVFAFRDSKRSFHPLTTIWDLRLLLLFSRAEKLLIFGAENPQSSFAKPRAAHPPWRFSAPRKKSTIPKPRVVTCMTWNSKRENRLCVLQN